MSTRIKINAICMALIFFLALFTDLSALPLTDTIYTIPENDLEFVLHEEVHQVDKNYRIDHLGIGFGVLPDLSLWFVFQYIHLGVIKSDSAEIGDAFLKIWYYFGDCYNDSIHFGLLFQIRFPTGKDAYYSRDWRNVAFGNNEIKIGAITQFDIHKRLYLHFNLHYIFREGKNENFYGGFYLNPFKKDTYVKVLGLNPSSEGAFFYWERFKNDYMSISIALNTDIIYPFIPYIEFYSSFRLYRGGDETDDLPLIPCGVNPVLFSLGIRYFFSESIFLGLYSVFNPVSMAGTLKAIYGLDFGIQF